ncbi:MAG: sulfatase-like hydrolase/transferase [Verrucomicrobiae bacterium]|nr:sulfatase-like hydrolase/transferase [Verrucomicrobiae bacterium]
MNFPKAILLFAVAVGSVPAAPKPDVLVVLTDQWSPRYLSWENPQVLTPNLDQIAREGMIFDACYTTSPVCMPARVSLLTGLYPHNAGHSLWSNSQNYYARPEAATMFRDIRAAGYTTAQIGKLHWNSGSGWQRDFKTITDYYHALGLDHVLNSSGPVDSPKARGPYADHLRKLGLLESVAADMRARYLKSQYEPRPSLVKPEDYHDVFVAKAAADYILQQRKGKPLCLVVSFHSPHPPLDAPGEFATMFDPEKLKLPPNVPESYQREKRTLDRAATRKILGNYLGKIALLDHCIGRLVEAMRQRGTWDNALFLFTADHGEMMGAHGHLGKGRFYEESARVPLVIRWPGQIKVGRTVALAQMMDVYPTIVEAIGGTFSPNRFARSLLPVATGRADSVRDHVVSEIGTGAPLNLMLRDSRYKWWVEGGREFLYDLEADPFEMRNLVSVAEYSATLQRMRNQMLLHFRTMQLNHAEGYTPKVRRLRQQAEKER